MKLTTRVVLRMTRLAAHLKQNGYPSGKSPLKKFREFVPNGTTPDANRHFGLDCTSRTV